MEAPDVCHTRSDISLADCLTSGMAIFGLKHPSLLQFERDKKTIQSNLRTLYGISNIPCDTYLREPPDKIDPRLLGKARTHGILFDWVYNRKDTKTVEFTDHKEKGISHRFRYLNKVLLNGANYESEVNFLEDWEIKPSGKELHYPWVTDIIITLDNLMTLMCGGRALWQIENETFNPLKN